MLETKLEELKAELSELRAVIVELTSAMRSAPVSTAAPVEAKTESVVEMMKAELSKPDHVEIIREDLQDLCMTIVRNDRSKKADVKATIASFGGASTLKDVADSDLAALKVALEALQ